MKIQDEELANISIYRVREGLVDFNQIPWSLDLDQGITILKKSLDIEMISAIFSIDKYKAKQLQSELIDKGYITPVKFTPSAKGMALIQHVDRERISYEVADKLVTKLIKKAHEINTEVKTSGGEVFIEYLGVFGSFQRSEKDVGDVDIVLKTTCDEYGMPLDFEEDDRIYGLLNFDEYLNFTGEEIAASLGAMPTIIYKLDQ